MILIHTIWVIIVVWMVVATPKCIGCQITDVHIRVVADTATLIVIVRVIAVIAAIAFVTITDVIVDPKWVVDERDIDCRSCFA